MADTDNKVDEAGVDIDSPRLKHEVEEIIDREEAASPEEEPTITSEEPKDSYEQEQGETLEELKQRLQNLESRYSSSSKEGKRLAEELKQYREREEFLKSRWNAEELFDGYQPEPSPEERPITRRELEELQERQRWQSAEETFFSQTDNKDLNNPVMKKAVIGMLFTDAGELAYPNDKPIDAFKKAAKEVRRVLIGERQRGKEDIMKTRTEMAKAALEDGETGKRETPSEEEETIHEDEYVRMWQKHREETRGGW